MLWLAFGSSCAIAFPDILSQQHCVSSLLKHWYKLQIR
jgi:hypothetical protein